MRVPGRIQVEVKFEFMKISIDREARTRQALLRGPDQRTHPAIGWRRLLQKRKLETQGFHQEADCIHALTQIELEELRKRMSLGENLEIKYENALKQIEGLMEEKNQLRSNNGNLTMEMQQLIAKIAATESAKQREIDELKFTLTSQTNANSEKEKRELAQKYENEISRMEYEIRRLKEINETKNDEIETLQRELKRVNGYLEEEKAKQEHYQTLQNNLKEYEQRFGIFSHEIERLNAVLRTKANEAETFASQNKAVNEELLRKNQEIERLLDEGRRKDSRLTEISSTISEYQLKIRQLSENSEYLGKYEEKINLLSRELERLNNVLREKSN